MTAPPTRDTDLPVAVMLGAAVLDGGRPSPALDRRARHAAGLYLAGHAGALILCGGTLRHPPSEAEIARRLCRDLGVPGAALHLDDTSTTTLENLLNAAPILNRLGARRAILVTDRFHAPRALLVARRLGLDATADCPPPTGASRLRLARSHLREIPARLWYALRLRRGQRATVTEMKSPRPPDP